MFYHTAVPATTEEVPLRSVATTQNADQMYETVPDMAYQDAVSSVPEPANLASEYLTIVDTTPDQHDAENTQMYETVPDMDYLDPVPSALNQSKDENVNPTSDYLPMAPGKIAPNQHGAKNTKTDTRKQKNECSGREKHQSEARQTYEYVAMDAENGQLMESRNLTVEDDKPYDLPMAGYLDPSSAGIYTKLNVNKQNQEDQ